MMQHPFRREPALPRFVGARERSLRTCYRAAGCSSASYLRGPTVTARRVPRWSELSPLLGHQPIQLNPTERRLSRAHTIGDLRTIARRRTPRAVFDYTDGAAG